MQIMNPAKPGSNMKDHNGVFGHLDGCGRTAPLSTKSKNENGRINTPDYELYVDDYSSDNEKEAKDLVAASRVHIELSPEDSTIDTDKNILQKYQPVEIVYKDSTPHAFKDICVDEGVHTARKGLAESVVGHRSTVPCNNSKLGNLAEEANMNIVHEDGFKSTSLEECRADAAADCASKSEVNLITDTAFDDAAAEVESSLEFSKHEAFVNVHISESQIQSREEKCNATEKTTDIFCDGTNLVKDLRRKTSLKCLLESSNFGENDSSKGSTEMTGVQGRVITKEPNESCLIDCSSHSGELVRGIITFNDDSSKLAPSTKVEIHESVIRKQLNVDNSRIKFRKGESNFSVAGPLSDVVSYSRHIPFSGSITLQSDSNTTSTKSFTFPILPNEWHSSPVRMAKADRRHVRKHRWCNLGLFCCRF